MVLRELESICTERGVWYDITHKYKVINGARGLARIEIGMFIKIRQG